MQVDIHARLLSAVRTGNGEIALTFQVREPSVHYDPGQTYTIAEHLFSEAGIRARAGRRKANAYRGLASRAAGPTKRKHHAGRPTNKERVAKYIAEHGGTKEHAAKVLGIRVEAA